MPLENLHSNADHAWALWRITEDEEWFTSQVNPFETIPENLTNQFKRLEFLAGRVLLKELLRKWKLPFEGLTKDEAGKPFFKNLDVHLSLSHSYPYVAAIVDRKKIVGIDLEQLKEKLLRIAPRVLSSTELEDAAHDLTKHCIYWCAKETLIKIYGRKHLTLSKNLAIDPFVLQKNEGLITGKIIADDMVATIPLKYLVYDNFIVVVNA
jgi:4'-phosphopantetheinyl transferase